MKEINSDGFNMADDTHKVRVEERLKIKIAEAKHLPARNHGAGCHRDAYCVLCLDQEEIFRTSTNDRTLNPFFGEEFQFEVPRRFRYLSIYVFDRDKHQDKVLGKVAIKREDLHRYNNKDHWFSLRPVDADSEVQGKAHIEVTLADSRSQQSELEPKPPDPDTPDDNKNKHNLLRFSDYYKDVKSGSSSSKKSEPNSSLCRSESLKEGSAGSLPLASQHVLAEVDSEDSPHGVIEYWSDPERHCESEPPDTVKLRIIECSELTTKNGHCDPFALITVHYSNGRLIKKRTKTKKKTVNPLFDEQFSFDLILEADPKDKESTQTRGHALEARVGLWHDAATPVFLGEVRVQLIQASPAPTRAWYFLSSRKEGAEGAWWSRGSTPPGSRLSAGGSALGALRLLLHHTIDHVFPVHHYSALERLFLDSALQKPITSSAVCILGELVANKTDAAQPLVRLFMHHDQIVPIIRELADAEISLLTDPTTIFRGNTLVSKMMDEAMRVCGGSYLRAVLRPTLAAIVAERRPCEIDPVRAKPLTSIPANLNNLKDYIDRVITAITGSYALCPPLLVRLFDALRGCATRHFPKNQEVRYSVVSGFIFLRFFAPAILGPRLFDLTNQHIDPQTYRTLTLISKMIMSLGNSVSSRTQPICKEEYMSELYKSFCTPQHVQAIRQFLEIISSSSDTQNSNVQDTPVLLKEGTMLKRDESFAGSSPGSTRRRRWPRGNAHAKKRHFRLTSGEVSWNRVGSRSGGHRLSLSGVIAVSAVDPPPAAATLETNNIFQIVHRECVVYIQANNCVERAEWVRLLTTLCRRPAPHHHPGYFRDNRWTCCDRTEATASGCSARDSEEPNCGDAALALRLDPPRDLQRLHALLVQHSTDLDERLLRLTDAPKDEANIVAAATLRDLQKAMFDLEHRHRTYRRSLARETKYGSKQAPIGDDNYLHLAGAGPGRAAGGGGAVWCREYSLAPPPPRVPPRAPHPAPPPLMPKPAPHPAPAPGDYCRLKVGRDDPDSGDSSDRDDYGIFSRVSIQRKSNPIIPLATATKPLKTSNSTSNVHDAGATSKPPLSERLTPFFLKKKPKPPPKEESTSSKSGKKEESLLGRLTPRFNQSRLVDRGRSLDVEAGGRRVERSSTSCSTRSINSSIVGNYKLFSLHKYGPPEPPVHGHKFVQNTDDSPPSCDDARWRNNSLLAATDTDIRL